MGTRAFYRLGLFALTAIHSAGSAVNLYFNHSWANILLTVVAGLLGALLSARHVQIMKMRRATAWPKPPFAAGRTFSRPKSKYCLFVLGSGGHTKEMLMMMDDGTQELNHMHRRYLISSGDKMSRNHLEDYEAELRLRSESAGTYDTCVVTRARRVHQPLWSTPWTALLSVLDIFPVLLLSPGSAVGGERKVPDVIYSNGPATGFFVALAVHVLRLLSMVADHQMKFVYIESWARISTLSLTGKLLYYTGLADAFYVQHGEVATRYAVVNAGEMVFHARRLEGDS